MLLPSLQRVRNSRLFSSSFVYFAVSLSTLIGLVISSLNARPIQDDYATLYLISDHGIFGFLELTWRTHGGNLTPMLINALFLYPSVFGLNFWALSLFPLVNYALLVLSIYSVSAILNPFAARNFTKIQIFTFANLVFLGSESLFSPQFLEMTLFSSAVLVHLWPILFFFLALGLLNNHNKVSLGLIVPLGFMSGNSNISESLFIQLSCLLILLLSKYQSGFFVKVKRLYLFALSNLAGAIMILSAPGFWARASEKNAQGIPDQFGEIVFRFVKSLTVFSADVLSHPMLLIFVIIGYKFSSNGGNFIKKFSTFGVLLFILLFASLVLGATIAYPAWHQSIGLVLLSPFVGMSIGDWLGSKKRISPKVGIAFFFIAVFIVLISLTRAFWSIESRAQRWDSGFSQNYCAVLSSESDPLIGTETIYPVSNLGIEDMNRWPWMRDAFTGWVTNWKFPAKDC
jgi:hypothetical protein